MRSVGLDVDGPARWGTKPPTRAPGIFVIETEQATRSAPFDIVALRHWLEHVPALRLDGARPTESALADRLATFWVPGQTLLYVGRTAKSLGPRVGALYATKLGDRRPHAGGHWLKTLRDQQKLRLWWVETDAPEEYEDGLLSAFAEALPENVRAEFADRGMLMPWANLGSPTGSPRETGLTDSLVDNETDAAGNVLRSDGTGTMAKRKPASRNAAPRSPRRTSPKPAASKGKREEATPMTAEGLAAMQAELIELKTVQRPEVVERVKNARELGDLRENADYEAARNEQSFLEGRILALEQQLRTAVVIEASTGNSIAMGSTVRYELEGTSGEMTIVGSTESDPAAGRISAASPVGKALLGHRVGDTVTVRTPAAEMLYRILEIG